MKSKVLKRAIAIMLCMVIVLNGAEYMRAGGSEGTDENAAETTQEEEIVLAEDQGEDVPDPEAPVAEEGKAAEKDEAANAVAGSGEEGKNPEQQEAAAGSGEEGKTPEQPEAGGKEEQPAEEPAAEKTEAEPELEPVTELTWENEQVCITVSAETEDIIPRGARLSVTPIEKKETDDSMAAEEKAQVEEINAQYDATAEKLQEKAEGEDYDILGFLAYDIKFVDEEGHKTEPDGSVSVTMDYKEAAIPEEVKKAQENGTEIADVTLMHLEEHSNGEVKDVIDMVADESQEASVQTTANTEVAKAEFATESFSTFTLVWKATERWSNSIKINCVTTDGKEIRTNWEITFGKETGTVTKTVEEVGKELIGYQFEKATLGSIDGTEVKRLQCKVERGTGAGILWDPYSYTWSYSTKDSGNDWTTINNNTTIYFQYTDCLMDLDGNSISQDQYKELVENANKAQEGTLPITWTRSKNVVEESSDRELSWDPGTMIAKFGDQWYEDLTDVWDGSRSKDDGKTSKHNFIKYLPDNQITVKEGFMYDSASWKKDGSDNYYLFRGTFDLENLTLGTGEQYGNYNFTIKSVVDEDKIYINDNMFVFVYPDDGTKIDKSNWQEYLAFWTGTVNENEVKNFNNSVPGRKATHGEATGFAKVTDGWYTGLVTDEAGNIIQHALSTGHRTKFRIDVIAHDNAEGGGMYRLKLEAKKDPSKVTFRFRKVDKDTNEGIEGTTFYLTPDTGDGASYYLTTNDEGYASAIVPTGTYTLRETKAHKYYQTTSNEWTVKVETGQVTMTAKTGNDGTATLGENATTGWYITNTKRTDIKPALNAPQHNKTIYKNAKDDYTLSLDVKGAVGAADPIDVLLIVDESSSMNETRRNNVTNAINTLKANLQASEAKDNIRLAVVGFSGDEDNGKYNDAWAYTDTTGSAWKTLGEFSYTAQKRAGTNWQAGIKKGEELLKNRSGARINAATYVVFLTDGEPTFYYNKNGYTDGKGSKFDQNAYDKAVTEWTSSSYMYGATKYVVDATDSGNNTNCTNLANAVGATKKLSGANGTEMQNAFKAIADSITKPKYDKVVITDTLSEYVDFQDNPDVKVYADNTELTENVDYECTINKATKTITVNLLKGGALEKDVVYKVTFKVKPTELAYKTYAESGYNAKGDKDTDTNPKEQVTSSEKDGFSSNTTAKVSYKVNGLSDSAEYKHPVVQVDLGTTSWSVEKQWVGGPEDSVKVQLTAKYDAKNEKDYTGNGEGGSSLKDVPPSYQSLTADMRKEQTLTENKTDASKNWAYTWENLPKYYYYTAKDNTIAKAEIQYSVTEVKPSEKYTVTYEDKKAESKTVITNTVKYRWQLVKVSTSKGADGNVLTIPNATFTLTDGTNTYTGTSGTDGVVTWKDSEGKDVERIPQGIYTLTETKAPNGYLLSDVSWTVDTTGEKPVVKAGTTVITANEEKDAQDITTYSFQFKNAPNYELPSTGGIGTYWYTIGGMLMMAAALVLYRKKKYTK